MRAGRKDAVPAVEYWTRLQGKQLGESAVKSLAGLLVVRNDFVRVFPTRRRALKDSLVDIHIGLYQHFSSG